MEARVAVSIYIECNEFSKLEDCGSVCLNCFHIASYCQAKTHPLLSTTYRGRENLSLLSETISDFKKIRFNEMFFFTFGYP